MATRREFLGQIAVASVAAASAHAAQALHAAAPVKISPTLARGNGVRAVDHQSTPGGNTQTGDRSRALWLCGQRDGAGNCHGRRRETKGQTSGPQAGSIRVSLME